MTLRKLKKKDTTNLNEIKPVTPQPQKAKAFITAIILSSGHTLHSPLTVYEIHKAAGRRGCDSMLLTGTKICNYGDTNPRGDVIIYFANIVLIYTL